MCVCVFCAPSVPFLGCVVHFTVHTSGCILLISLVVWSNSKVEVALVGVGLSCSACHESACPCTARHPPNGNKEGEKVLLGQTGARYSTKHMVWFAKGCGGNVSGCALHRCFHCSPTSALVTSSLVLTCPTCREEPSSHLQAVHSCVCAFG